MADMLTRMGSTGESSRRSFLAGTGVAVPAVVVGLVATVPANRAWADPILQRVIAAPAAVASDPTVRVDSLTIVSTAFSGADNEQYLHIGMITGTFVVPVGATTFEVIAGFRPRGVAGRVVERVTATLASPGTATFVIPATVTDTRYSDPIVLVSGTYGSEVRGRWPMTVTWLERYGDWNRDRRTGGIGVELGGDLPYDPASPNTPAPHHVIFSHPGVRVLTIDRMQNPPYFYTMQIEADEPAPAGVVVTVAFPGALPVRRTLD